MKVHNAYPEKPEVPYMRTTVSMPEVVAFLKTLDETKEIKRAAYMFFRMESANGKSGVNNNYAGVQADGNRWPVAYDELISATTVTPENKTNKVRRFVVFDKWQDSVKFTVENVARRGMYIGGETFHISKLKVRNLTDLVKAYKREWVTGNEKYMPTEEECAPFISIYKQAEKIFI